MKTIYIISDGTGRTAEQTLMAALTQFPKASVNIILKQDVRSESQLEPLITLLCKHPITGAGTFL